MGILWILFALSAAVLALPKRDIDAEPLISRTASNSGLHQFCDVTETAGTVVGVCDATTINSAGHTVISNTNGAITLSTGINKPITTTFPNGQTTKITPSDLIIETINAAGHTIISNVNGAITLPTDATKPIKTTLPNGRSTTITPLVVQQTATPSPKQTGTVLTTNAAGRTVISDSDGALTLPTGRTKPLTTTLPDGHTTVINPEDITVHHTSSSSGAPGLFLIPVTTSVPSPKPTDGGILIPCDYFWFFNLCIHWDDFPVLGWILNVPPGIYPPGPPPSLRLPPSISISISAPLPDWGRWTLPPTGAPTVQPEPKECKTETGELCFYKTVTSIATTSHKTTTTSQVHSTCATVTGCAADDKSFSTSSTATEAPSSTTYVVYPSDGTNKGQVESIAKQLRSIVKDDSSIHASNTKTFGLNYWLLPLNEALAEKIAAIPNVASIYAQCESTCHPGGACTDACYDPTIEVVYQSPAEDQLTYISWPQSLPQPLSRYIFDDSAGDKVPVYIVDTGAELSRSEFDLIRDRVKWLPEDGPHNDGNMAKDKFHGTAMLSLVAGKTLGIAKNVQPIMVRFPNPTVRYVDGVPKTSVLTPEQWLDRLGLVTDALGNDLRSAASAVVLLAQYYPREAFPTPNPNGWILRCHSLIADIISKGAVVVTGAGNVKRPKTIDGWPSNFGKSINGVIAIPSLIVAGAISGKGDIVAYVTDVQAGIPHVYAPGVDVIVAEGDLRLQEYTKRTGDSCAAAYTAGLAAYFVRLVQDGQLRHNDGSLVRSSPQSIKDFIIAQSWSRRQVEGLERPGIFNAVNVQAKQCPWNPAPPSLLRHRAAEGSCIEPSPPSTSTTPLETQPAKCHNEADFSGHGAILKSVVANFAGSACSAWTGYPPGTKDRKLGPKSEKLEHTYKQNGVDYFYSVQWIEGCTTTVSAQSVFAPLGSGADVTDQCLNLWTDCYKQCSNGGVGGSIDAGCLRYTFTGGEKI